MQKQKTVIFFHNRIIDNRNIIGQFISMFSKQSKVKAFEYDKDSN